MIAGEFSAAPNDCGLFMVGVGVVSANPQCPEYDDWPNYTDEMKAGLLNMVLATMDSLGDWFFWTWKVCLSPSCSLFHHEANREINDADRTRPVRKHIIPSMVLPTWPCTRLDAHRSTYSRRQMCLPLRINQPLLRRLPTLANRLRTVFHTSSDVSAVTLATSNDDERGRFCEFVADVHEYGAGDYDACAYDVYECAE